MEGRKIVLHFFHLGPLLTLRYARRNVRDGDFVISIGARVRCPIGEELMPGRWVQLRKDVPTNRHRDQRIEGEALGAPLHVAVGARLGEFETVLASEVFEEPHLRAEHIFIGDNGDVLDLANAIEARGSDFLNVLFPLVLGESAPVRTGRFSFCSSAAPTRVGRFFCCGGGTCRILMHLRRVG